MAALRSPKRALACTTLMLLGTLVFSALAPPALAQSKKVVIANFGPHGSLDQVVAGFKQAMADKGYIAGKTVTYDYSEVGFDPSLVPQMLTKLEAESPDLMLTVTTPVTQAAVKLVRNKQLPIVFASVTDPVAAGIVPSWAHGSARFVGASNMQGMDSVVTFARALLGDVHSFGILYDPAEANDVAAVTDAEAVAKRDGVTFRPIAVDSVGDIGQRVTALQGVDFIYGIPSNLLMPALPAIASAADRMKIPLISSSPQGAQDGIALAAVSVSWSKVGYQAGLLGAQILGGAKPDQLANYKPTAGDDAPVINGKRLKAMGKTLPPALADCHCVVD